MLIDVKILVKKLIEGNRFIQKHKKMKQFKTCLSFHV